MTGFSALGAASGLPLDDMVRQLVKVERDLKLGRIDTRKKQLDASISAFGKLTSSLTALQDAAKKLSGNQLTTRAVTLTQPDDKRSFISATAKNGAPEADFSVKVNQLAMGSRLESADMAFGSANDVVSNVDGTLNFAAGDKSFTVDVSAGMTLDQLRKKINEQSDNFGVNVNIINAGGNVGTKLVFNSTITGVDNQLSITSNVPELDALATVASDSSVGGLNQTQGAQNAIIEIDGIIATNSTNVFVDVIQDITITAQQVTPVGADVTISVGVDKDKVKDNIQEFIDKYNALVDEVKTLTKPREISEDGRTVNANSGTLNSDSTVRSVMNQLSRLILSPIEGADSSLNTLYALGITVDSDGKLEIQSTSQFGAMSGQERFDMALNDIEKLTKLFGGENGLATKLDSLIGQFTERDGLIKQRENALNKQLTSNEVERERVTRYLEDFEATMRKRYIALDSLLGRLYNTSNFVTAQLANLPKFGNNKN